MWQVPPATSASLLLRYLIQSQKVPGTVLNRQLPVCCQSSTKAPTDTSLPKLCGVPRSQEKSPLESQCERVPKLLYQLMSYLL